MNANKSYKFLWLTISAIVGFGLIYFFKKIDSVPKDSKLMLTPSVINADGNSSALIEYIVTSKFGRKIKFSELKNRPKFQIVEGKDLVKIFRMNDSLSWRLVSNYQQGEVVIRVTSEDFIIPSEVTLSIVPSLASSSSSYPEELILNTENDKKSFKYWFTTLAKMQFKKDAQWTALDCAGLIRYSFCEALKKHDSKWFSARQKISDVEIQDVVKYNYPNIPILGTKIFQIDCRDNEDSIIRYKENCYSNFADASRLKDNSLSFITRLKKAQKADIIFYLNDSDPKWPYHTMIYLGNDEVIYHNGGEGNEGLIKHLTLTQLSKHPNKLWHPNEENPNFLGFYRWKIL